MYDGLLCLVRKSLPCLLVARVPGDVFGDKIIKAGEMRSAREFVRKPGQRPDGITTFVTIGGVDLWRLERGAVLL